MWDCPPLIILTNLLFMARSRPLLTGFGLYYRLESCDAGLWLPQCSKCHILGPKRVYCTINNQVIWLLCPTFMSHFIACPDVSKSSRWHNHLTFVPKTGKNMFLWKVTLLLAKVNSLSQRLSFAEVCLQKVQWQYFTIIWPLDRN